MSQTVKQKTYYHMGLKYTLTKGDNNYLLYLNGLKSLRNTLKVFFFYGSKFNFLHVKTFKVVGVDFLNS